MIRGDQLSLSPNQQMALHAFLRQLPLEHRRWHLLSFSVVRQPVGQLVRDDVYAVSLVKAAP